jgi:Protein of unknown function (DUF3365)
MKAKIFLGLGTVFSCGILIAALSAADATPAPAVPVPTFSFVDSDDPAVADIAKFGSDAIQNIGGQLVSEVTRELAAKETSVAVSILHLKNLEIPKSKPGQPTITAVRRTSLLVRNRLNTPDAADQAALEKIQDQLENGDHVSKLLVQRVDHPNAPVEWRVYRPIAATQACLACHGDPSTFRPGVKEALDRLYPDDKATGDKEQTWRGFIRVSLAAPQAMPAATK